MLRAALPLSIAAATLLACTRRAPAIEPDPPPSAAPAPTSAPGHAVEIDERFREVVLDVAREYRAMARADGAWAAPVDCRAPIPSPIASRAPGGEHARKVYTLWIKDPKTYATATKTHPVTLHAGAPLERSSRLEQALVKESFTPVETAKLATDCKAKERPQLGPVLLDGKPFSACEPAGLFVMARVGAVDGADDGWVYGTARADASAPFGYAITSAGRVASCMHCHEKAPHGRLFGLPAD